MKEFYHKSGNKPKIFGMTASPVIRKGNSFVVMFISLWYVLPICFLDNFVDVLHLPESLHFERLSYFWRAPDKLVQCLRTYSLCSYLIVRPPFLHWVYSCTYMVLCLHVCTSFYCSVSGIKQRCSWSTTFWTSLFWRASDKLVRSLKTYCISGFLLLVWFYVCSMYNTLWSYSLSSCTKTVWKE